MMNASQVVQAILVIASAIFVYLLSMAIGLTWLALGPGENEIVKLGTAFAFCLTLLIACHALWVWFRRRRRSAVGESDEGES